MKAKLAQTFALLIAAAAGGTGTYYYDEHRAELMAPQDRLRELHDEAAEIVAEYRSGAYELKQHDPRWKYVHDSAVQADKGLELLKTARNRIFSDIARIETAGPMPKPDPKPEPQPDPLPEPEPDPELPWDVNLIYIDASRGTSDVDGVADGLTPETAVATVERAKAVAYAVRNVDPGAKLAFLFRRGGVFTPFGFLIAYRDGVNKPSLGMNGTAEWSTLFTGYGDGAKPEFRGDGDGECFRSNGGASYMEFRDLHVRHTGSALTLLGAGTDIRIVGCDFEASGVNVQGTADRPMVGLEITDTVIYNCLKTGSAHSSGIFVNYCNGVSLKYVALICNGWKGTLAWDGDVLVRTVDAELGDDIFSHGLYGQYTCGPIRCEGVVAVFNAGAGLQMRSGGDLLDSFVGFNGETGVVWGGAYTGNAFTAGEIARNVIANHSAGALIVNGCKSGHIHDNLIVNATADLGGGKMTGGPLRYSILLSGEHGTTAKGDTRYGVNDLTFEGNRITGETYAQYDGWGLVRDYFPDAPAPTVGVVIRGNATDSAFTVDERDRGTKFSDPLGMYTVIDRESQEGQAVEFTLPERDDAMLRGFIDRTLDAAKLIGQTGGVD